MQEKDSFSLKGNINQFQSMGTVDGPGVRYVVFLQGCPLRCVYCHNPETWDLEGKAYTVHDVLNKILSCRSYISQGGGVTVSGGEPLLQWAFVKKLFTALRQEGIHTLLDTSGIGDLEGAKALLSVTDMVVCDLKFATEAEYLKYTKGSLRQVLEFLKLTEQQKIPLWIRHVIVPGLTDHIESVKQVSRLARGFSNLEKIELLPFKKLCTAKYDEMGLCFPLAETDECSDALLENLEEALQNFY